MASITKNSKEYLIIDLTDLLGTVTDLSSSTPTFIIYTGADQSGGIKQSSTAATAVAMRLYCLCDTSTGGGWTPGTYSAYVTFAEAPEQPLLGPFQFTVVI